MEFFLVIIKKQGLIIIFQYGNNPFPGVTIESKKDICKYFNQSGFPSEYLIEKKTGKVLKAFMGIQGLEPELY